MEGQHDMVVLSDLHLGEGKVGTEGRYSPMEDFFYDDAFARFLQHLRERYANQPEKLVLVLNGDVFDFLTVTVVPSAEPTYPFSISPAEFRFGLNPTPSKSVYKLDQIVSGHQVFFQALADFVHARHRIEILRGNHDLELYFPAVQQKLVECLAEMHDELDMQTVQQRVRIHQRFYLEPGRIYIEHGNEYESSNSIRYPLRPILPDNLSQQESEVILDYPLGSLFVRYFYNGVNRIDPYTPKVGSLEEYLKDLKRYNLLDVLRIARDHYPFFIQALRREAPSGSAGPTSEGDRKQEEDFCELCNTTQPADLHRHLAQLQVKPLSATKLGFVKQMTKPILRRLGWVCAIAFVSLYMWLLIFNAIQLADSVFSKAILLSLFSILSMAGLLWLSADMRRRLRNRLDETVDICVQRADQIARLTGVKLVLMGHTHVVDHRKIADGQATYANSGTWTSIDNPWDRLHPDARRFTSLFVSGDQVWVMRWNDDAQRLEPVPLFDHTTDPQSRISPLHQKRLGHPKRGR